MKDNIALLFPELNVHQLNMLYRHIEEEKIKAVHDFIHRVKITELPKKDLPEGTRNVHNWGALPR